MLINGTGDSADLNFKHMIGNVMFPRDWKHFKKLLIKINIVLVIHATMNSGKNNLNCEAFCSACANISSSNQRASLGALRKTIRFYIVHFFWEVKWTLDTLFRISRSPQKFHKRESYFPRPFRCLVCDQTLPLVFNLWPEGVQSYHWRIVLTICFYRALSLHSFLLDCCSLVSE